MDSTIGTEKISITDKYGVSRNINMYQTQLKISCEMQNTVATWEIRREYIARFSLINKSPHLY